MDHEMSLAAKIDEDGNCPSCKRAMSLESPHEDHSFKTPPMGCVCPPGANLSCQNPICPRGGSSPFFNVT